MSKKISNPPPTPILIENVMSIGLCFSFLKEERSKL
jgi:hypothetical protein